MIKTDMPVYVWEFSDDWQDVELELTDEVRQRILATMLEMFAEAGFSGETIIQGDKAFIEVPQMLAELADNLPFKITYKD